MKAPERRRAVRAAHTQIAVAVATGDIASAAQIWEAAPVQYKAAMSLCMFWGRLGKARSENRRAREAQ